MDFKEAIRPHGLFLAAFGYFLSIALLRDTPYWPHGIQLTWQGGIVLAVLPLIPGILRRKTDWLLRGMLLSVLTPFQSGVMVACCVSCAVLITLNRRKIRTALLSFRGSRLMLAAAAAYGAFVLLHWTAAWGSVHTAYSAGYTAATQFVAPSAAFLAALLWDSDKPDDPLRAVYVVLLAQAATLAAYPLVIGKPMLLASIVNGFMKPMYTLLELPWTYPWFDPDWNPGSLSIVNYTGIVMIMTSVLALLRYISARRHTDALFFVCALCLAFMAENTIAAGAAVWAFGLALLLDLLLRLSTRLLSGRQRAGVAMAAGIAGIAALVSFVYLGHGRYAGTQKGHFYRQAFERLSESPLRALIGYGPGAYGSRAALLRLDSNVYTARDGYLWTYGWRNIEDKFPANDFVEDIKSINRLPAEWINASQGLIYSGIVPSVMENGLLGLALIFIAGWPAALSIAERMTRIDREILPLTGTAIFCALFLGCLAVFYNYNEIPTLSFLLLLPMFLLLCEKR